ncbi:hypothetical protein EVAR_59996_1 [Eumeta japonica]|uniref:Uncharacterized protein n=1 Tax=Eumeta variegata TaxID=151549 RepID=A0A4C1ZEZ2_EUMVA|nr:hypothetical protein EVAR_59996_1 [Eumeta japonica]
MKINISEKRHKIYDIKVRHKLLGEAHAIDLVNRSIKIDPRGGAAYTLRDHLERFHNLIKVSGGKDNIGRLIKICLDTRPRPARGPNTDSVLVSTIENGIVYSDSVYLDLEGA